MKTKVEIFSSQKLKIFFMNLENFFSISHKDFDELEGCYNSTSLSIVFFDQQDFVDEKTFNGILLNENFIFVYKDSSMLEKTPLDLKKNMVAPLSISKFIDRVNEIINKKKHAFGNIELNNNFITHKNTNEQNYLTHVEN